MQLTGAMASTIAVFTQPDAKGVYRKIEALRQHMAGLLQLPVTDDKVATLLKQLEQKLRRHAILTAVLDKGADQEAVMTLMDKEFKQPGVFLEYVSGVCGVYACYWCT